jgi:hypothetical protein
VDRRNRWTDIWRLLAFGQTRARRIPGEGAEALRRCSRTPSTSAFGKPRSLTLRRQPITLPSNGSPRTPKYPQKRGVPETKGQDESTTYRTRRNLQNLHPRFKSRRKSRLWSRGRFHLRFASHSGEVWMRWARAKPAAAQSWRRASILHGDGLAGLYRSTVRTRWFAADR